MIAQVVTIAAGIWLVAAFVTRALAARALRRLILAGSATPSPSSTEMTVALVRPLHGDPEGGDDTLASLFRAAERGTAVVRAAVASGADPAGDVFRRVARAHPSVDAALRTGGGSPGTNPKVVNLLRALEGAGEDVFVLSDADVRVPEDYVVRHRAAFSDREVGLVTTPYRSVPARGFASRIDALLTNLHFLPNTCLAVEFEGCHFGLGASLAVRRTALERVGGFENLVDESADDYWVARRIESSGSRLEFLPMIVDHMLEDEGWFRPIRRHLRWNGTVRGLRPAGYGGLILTHGCLAVCVLLSLSSLLGAAAAAAYWVASMVVFLPVARRLGLAAVDLALFPIVDLLASLAWILGWFVGQAPPVGANVARNGTASPLRRCADTPVDAR